MNGHLDTLVRNNGQLGGGNILLTSSYTLSLLKDSDCFVLVINETYQIA